MSSPNWEYVIQRDDDGDISWPPNEHRDFMRPLGIAYKSIEGYGVHRIEIEGEEISFSDEGFGIQICFEGGTLSRRRADEVVEAIRLNMQRINGQPLKAVTIT